MAQSKPITAMTIISSTSVNPPRSFCVLDVFTTFPLTHLYGTCQLGE